MLKDWISSKVEIRDSGIEGKGMFAISPILENEKIIVWGGKYVAKEKADIAQEEGKLVMQWDENLYSVEERGEDKGYFVNHSCDPNVWMDDYRTLMARRDIKEGEEITADYALWEADESFVSSWKCACSSPLCREKVTGSDWKDKELQERYKGHFSPLINKRIKSMRISPKS